MGRRGGGGDAYGEDEAGGVGPVGRGVRLRVRVRVRARMGLGGVAPLHLLGGGGVCKCMLYVRMHVEKSVW